MSLPGLRSTNDFAAEQRPQNWREAILVNKVRFGTPLFSLTAAMQSKSTNDPQFNWWEEEQPIYDFRINGALTISDTTIVVDKNATLLKAGDMLAAGTDGTGEVLIVTSVTNDTTFDVVRAQAGSTAAAIADNSLMLFIGSAYREGAPAPQGTAYNPVKQSNFTQIFREPVEWTRTAINTNLRTGKERIQAQDKRRALHKHSTGVERALWLGRKFETTEAGQPKRWTGGILERIPAANTTAATPTGSDLDELESWMEAFFRYGSSEKLAFCSVATLIKIGQIVRKNSQYQWGPSENEYGLRVRRLHTPAGTLALTEMPLFGVGEGGFLAEDMIVLDTSNLVWRYLEGGDTKYLTEREARGTDGKKDEWLTEGGLEIHHASTTFHRITGIKSAAVDN